MTPRELGVLAMDFIMLHVKMILLLAWDFYNLLFPEEQIISGEIALVTGAGGSLGRELSLQLSRKGAILVLWDVNQNANEDTARLIEKEGGEVYAFTCDVSDYKSVVNTANKVRKVIGNPSYVFSNAGIYYHKSFLEHSADEIENLVQVNLLGNLWMSKEFVAPMMESNKGHFVCISSILGFVGRPNVVPYCASKWGVKGLTEALSEEVRMERRSGVVITAVHPFLISNITDVSVNIRIPFLFEILTPKDAAARIIKGVRRNEEEIFLPEKLKPFMLVSKVLPRSVRRAAGDFMEN